MRKLVTIKDKRPRVEIEEPKKKLPYVKTQVIATSEV